MKLTPKQISEIHRNSDHDLQRKLVNSTAFRNKMRWKYGSAIDLHEDNGDGIDGLLIFIPYVFKTDVGLEPRKTSK